MNINWFTNKTCGKQLVERSYIILGGDSWPGWQSRPTGGPVGRRNHRRLAGWPPDRSQWGELASQREWEEATGDWLASPLIWGEDGGLLGVVARGGATGRWPARGRSRRNLAVGVH